MASLRALSILILACCAGTVSGYAGSNIPPGLSRRPQELVSGQVIVRFRSSTTLSARAAVLRSENASVAKAALIPDTFLLRIPEERLPNEAAAALMRRPEVLHAEPNWRYRYLNTPNDPQFAQLWGLHQANDADIDAVAAWEITTGSASVIVGITDSGVAYQHPDLSPNIWVNDDPPDGIDNDGNGFVDDTHGWDFIDGDNAPTDPVGHGTHVAGTIGARGNNGLGVTGVNWHVSLMPLRVGDEFGPTVFGIINGFAYACANGARVVNGSFGGPNSQFIQDAVLNCPQVLFVFAAGNDGLDLDASGVDAFPCELHLPPASAPNVLCVAATTQTDALASFSNHGTTAVHLAAPGNEILSSVPAYSPLPGFPDSFEDAQFDSLWGLRTSLPGNVLWGRRNGIASHGAFSLSDSPTSNYVNSSFTTIRRIPTFDLTNLRGCRVSFDLRLAVEFDFDFLVVLGGADTASNTELGAWTGSTGGQFFRVSDSLGSMETRTGVYVGFALQSDSSIVGDGAYVDQVLAECLNPTGENYDFFSGTSMSTPHVAGVAALLLAQDPTRDVAALKSSLLGSVDPLSSLANATITGGRLNACRALGVSASVCNSTGKRRQGQVTSE